MAQNIFDTSKIYKTRIWGHSFSDFPGSDAPELPGTFAADTVETDGELTGGVAEYAIFTVSQPSGDEYPASWAGTYALPYSKIVENPPEYIGDVPTPPDPDPEPDPDPDEPGGDDPGDNPGGDDPDPDTPSGDGET